MIIYESIKKDFIEDFLDQRLVDALADSYKNKVGRVRDSERKSWDNSLMFMYQVLEDDEIPDDI